MFVDSGTTQRDGMGREEGGGFRMGNTCIPVVPEPGFAHSSSPRAKENSSEPRLPHQGEVFLFAQNLRLNTDWRIHPGNSTEIHLKESSKYTIGRKAFAVLFCPSKNVERKKR